MELQQLKAFVAVAHWQSFSQAAESLFLTQPAISKRISALEAHLQCKLFDRIGKGVHLSAQGRALLPRATQILRAIDAARMDIAQLSGSVAGKLSIATSHHIGLHRLADVLRQYHRDYPEVELDIKFLDSEQGCNAVASGELELAVATLPHSPSDMLICRPIWDDPLALVASHQHPLAKIKKLSWQDLSAARAILPTKGTFTRHIIEEAMSAQAVKLQVAMQTNYLQTIKMMVSIGLGWSALPLQMLHADELCLLHIHGLSLKRQLGSVVHKNHHLSTAAQAFLAILHAQAA